MVNFMVGERFAIQSDNVIGQLNTTYIEPFELYFKVGHVIIVTKSYPKWSKQFLMCNMRYYHMGQPSGLRDTIADVTQGPIW